MAKPTSGGNNLYINAAEAVLQLRGVPLTADEIIQDGRLLGVLPQQTYPTIHKTLQARIAEDIARLQGRSRFVRTGTGTYFLRRLLADTTVFGAVRLKQVRRGRAKPEHRARLLVVKRDNLAALEGLEGMDERLNIVSSNGAYIYAKTLNSDFVPVICATALCFREKRFVYSCGQHSYFQRLTGLQSILVRRFVDEFDLDLFYHEPIGVAQASVRSIWPLIESGRPSASLDGVPDLAKGLKILKVAYERQNDSISIVCKIDLDQVFESLPLLARRMEFRMARWADAPLKDQSTGGPWDDLSFDVMGDL